MGKLEELQKKYELARYEPAPDCSRCGGKGEIWKEGGEIFNDGFVPCLCIFTHPDDRADVFDAFRQFGEKLKRERHSHK
ncbi:MAG TPA: hypothetical protein VJS44_08500 [Pyrinomonadaceae bacterium]|nr:hypothetical protein [Pyrinomonadaceae bacterium]